MIESTTALIWNQKKDDTEFIEKIKDKKLKKYLREYIQYKHPRDLLKILEYFDVHLDLDYYKTIISQFKIFKEGILLGIFDEDGIAQLYILRIHDDFYVLSIFKVYYRNIPEFWREYGTVYRTEKRHGIYKCGCGYQIDDFREFAEHFLNHNEIKNRFDQIMDEMRILKEEEKGNAQ
ncbi:MAG: hypothetical protein L7G90_01860 [Candidatus Nanopusillus sp.]|jgi:hypothetical protein|nr:hypothetical protein [Candidatus Nanopusillus sp.]MCG2868848.1 hypothetical protein [Candidatus Nanopusillus sp.]